MASRGPVNKDGWGGRKEKPPRAYPRGLEVLAGRTVTAGIRYELAAEPEHGPGTHGVLVVGSREQVTRHELTDADL